MLKKKYLTLIFALSSVLTLAFFGCKSTPEDDTGEEPEQIEKTEEPEQIEKTEEPEVLDFSASNASKITLVNEAREAAVKAGAEKYAQSAFNAAEAEYLTVKASSSDSATDITVVADDLIARYKGLEAYSDALFKKEYIDTNSYSSYDQKDYDDAGLIIDELSKNLVVTGKDFYEKASSADSKYTLVLATAFKKIANDERSAAVKAKKDADAVKASVSQKELYKAAVDLLNKGDSNYATGNAEDAASDYRSAKDAFTSLAQEVTKAREQALAAIEAAKQRTQNSENLAAEADEKVPLADGAEGIEAEDAVLLEEDDFSALENTEIAVDENAADVSLDDIAGKIELESSTSEEVKSDQEVVESLVEDVVEKVDEVPEK